MLRTWLKMFRNTRPFIRTKRLVMGRPLSLESLETREVPASFTGGLVNRTLIINGTTGNDTIILRQSGNVVTLDGYSPRWDVSQISKIQINAGSGNDTVTLSVSKQLAATLVASGGNGHDTLKTTAQPASWTGFEVRTLIAAQVSNPVPAVQVVYTGSSGPYAVSYYRRGAPTVGELETTVKTRQEADAAVAAIQKRAAYLNSINNDPYWDIVKITVEGSGVQSGNSSSLTSLFTSAFQGLADRYR